VGDEDEPVPVLYTPAEAAELLRVPESWLRRKAGDRQVPCTLLGPHLRFSTADLNTIVTEHTQPAGTRHSQRRRRR
jgi:excisionase family DNA binding protein